jgi:hypothetical protein
VQLVPTQCKTLQVATLLGLQRCNTAGTTLEQRWNNAGKTLEQRWNRLEEGNDRMRVTRAGRVEHDKRARLNQYNMSQPIHVATNNISGLQEY